MLVEVEVVDVPFDQKHLLGQNWIYPMKEIMSFVFRVVFFPFEDRIVMIDQMSFDNYVFFYIVRI